MMMATNAQERRAKRPEGADEDDLTVEDCDDYLIVRQIESVYLHLEKIQSKLETDATFCPNYEMVRHVDNPLTPEMRQAGCFAQIYELMMCEDSSLMAFGYYAYTIALILISLISLVFEEEFPSSAWETMELIITVFFTAEYILTLIIVNNKCAFICSASAFDILAVMPYYIELIAGDASWILLVRLLRIARMNRIRQSPNPYVFLIGKTLGGVVSILSGIFLWLSIGSLIIGTFVHVLEPETFYSVPIGMWFGLVTLTTVGYGDISPETTDGYLVGSVAIIFGLCLCSIVLQAVGQIYNDNIEILKDQMMEIKQALFEMGLIEVRNGDDLHIREKVTFDHMIRCCMDDSKCYPKINQLLIEARKLSNLHDNENHTYLPMHILKDLIGEKAFEKVMKDKAKEDADGDIDGADVDDLGDGTQDAPSAPKRGPGSMGPMGVES